MTIKQYMTIKKQLATLLSGIFLSGQVLANNISNQEFLESYDIQLQSMLSNYEDKNLYPLHTKIFDINNPLFLSFLKNSTGQTYEKELLAMQFYKNFKVNNQPTNFCFILYDSKKSPKINIYINSIFKDKNNAILYLVAHEFGHCVTYHKKTLGMIKEADARDLELIADMYCVAFFISRHQHKVAQVMIEGMGQLPKDDIHNNYEQLKKYYEVAKDNKFMENDIEKMFNHALEYYYQYKR